MMGETGDDGEEKYEDDVIMRKMRIMTRDIREMSAM